MSGPVYQPATSTRQGLLTAAGFVKLDDLPDAADFGTASTYDVGTAAGELPVLVTGGKLPESVLPSIAITDVSVVASEAAMLALTAERGDIAVRSDLNKTFALSTNSPGTLADWIELRTPTDAVLSVAGRTGAVTLAQADVSGLVTDLGNKQPLDGTLTALAGVTTAADKLIYATGADAFATTDLSAFARGLLDDADASAARSTLGLVIGTNVQAQDAELAAIAGLTSAANKLPYFTGSGTAAVTDLSSFGRSLLDDADAAATQTTIGYTAADVLAKLLTVDGSGTGVDADLLDGQHGSYYAPLASPTFTGTVTAAALNVGADSTWTDGVDIAVGTTTGTKIGTATSQKLGFFNATPVVQQGGTTDIKDALTSLGLFVGTSASPLNLDGGALTAGTISASAAAFSFTSTLTRSGIATTSTDGVIVTNNTAATVGTPVQMSSRIRLRGNAWKSSATAASQTQDWVIENLPVTGTTSTSSILKFGTSNNGDAYTYPFLLNTSLSSVIGIAPGTWTAAQSLSVGGNTSQSGNSNSQSGYSNSQSGISNTQSGYSNTQGGISNTQGGNSNTQSGNSNSQSGYSNSQSGISNTQSGYSNSQSGISNTQSGNDNTQSGYRGIQAGQSLNDGGFSYAAMFGQSKTAGVGHALYAWVDNGLRLKPVSAAPASPENGTIYYDSDDHKFKGYANGTWVDLH
jgi:hypothetical protein